jgi:hypothetical protein
MHSSNDGLPAKEALDIIAAFDGRSDYLFEFAGTLQRVEHGKHGFNVRDVRTVVAVRGYPSDLDFCWRGAFILGLRDGRKVYIASACAPEFGEDIDTYKLEWEELDVEFLPPDLHHSQLPKDRQPDEHSSWIEAPRHLDEFLKRLTA